MRSVKPFCYYVALLLLLMLSSCGQPLAKTSVPIPSPAAQITPPATVFPSANTAVNPVRLLIPAIKVNAPIEGVGITASGDLAVPKRNPWEGTGWYQDGPRPGERGSAVIDGHLDRPRNAPAVFWRLRDLRVGNDVFVIDALGRRYHFRVTGVVLYLPQDAPLEQIFGNESGSFLNLITCAGEWLVSQNQTKYRLVVYTSLVGGGSMSTIDHG
ncbi:MAG: class F sortase [Ktedonobacteraceae bacterium]|nr:class F sortase [Ktedonobacteraceae bacterium]